MPNPAIPPDLYRPMAGDKSNGMIDVTMGGGNTGIAEPADTGRNAGILRNEYRLDQRLRFFAPRPNTNGSPSSGTRWPS